MTHEHDLVQYFGGRIINLSNGSVVFDNYIGGDEEYMEGEDEGK